MGIGNLVNPRLTASAGDFKYELRSDGQYVRSLCDGSPLSDDGPEHISEKEVPDQVRVILRSR
jgi:hypothetical protein